MDVGDKSPVQPSSRDLVQDAMNQHPKVGSKENATWRNMAIQNYFLIHHESSWLQY